MAKRQGLPREKFHPPGTPDQELSDEELWEQALEGVRPISRAGRRFEPARKEAPDDTLWPGDIFQESMAELRRIETWDRPEYVEGGPQQWNQRLLKKLRRGQFSIQEDLDLHGFTQDEARRELDAFLREASRLGHSCVRIIHGKGRNSPGNEAVLRKKVPQWLSHRRNRPYVAAFASARQRDGGSGAIYVLLRRGMKQLKEGRRAREGA